MQLSTASIQCYSLAGAGIFRIKTFPAGPQEQERKSFLFFNVEIMGKKNEV